MVTMAAAASTATRARPDVRPECRVSPGRWRYTTVVFASRSPIRCAYGLVTTRMPPSRYSSGRKSTSLAMLRTAMSRSVGRAPSRRTTFSLIQALPSVAPNIASPTVK